MPPPATQDLELGVPGVNCRDYYHNPWPTYFSAITRHQVAIESRNRKTHSNAVFVSAAFLTHRADVDGLFGRKLLGRGHQIYLVRQAKSGAALWIAKQTDEVQMRVFEPGRTWVIQNRDYARISDAVEQKYVELLH